MSWPSVIILAPEGQRSSLEERMRSFELVPDVVTGDERLHWQGYSYHLDLSGGILADFEPEELEQITARIGTPYGVYVSGQCREAVRVLLGHVLPGFDGLVDTNHDDILPAHEFLALLSRHPPWDWRRVPRADLRQNLASGST
ncbi:MULTISPECIES: hypothetical protein [unclassified Streptomyces]|uniref:hypothetical protein n=1 Tax=unclassified Streptomyces TaxID=2593676 RepID=UPI00093FC85E|nr:hypothetical protein [Streptomyces sp. TSRI0281]OKI45868.1 hypothetical protein A6A29_30325 [Streptomyces sp. TSRI0281]